MRTMSDEAADRAAIEAVITAFFAAFTSTDASTDASLDTAGVSDDDRADDRWDGFRALFQPEAVLVRTCGLTPTAYDVEAFIAPRRALLEGGGLTGFREWVVSGRLDLFGDIAAWFGGYAKAGVQDGEPLSGRGMKSVQLVRTSDGWRIAAAVWDDERPGVRYPD